MKTVDVLRKARRILANPKRFCKGTAAMDAEGTFVRPMDPNAKKFDALGAIVRVGGGVLALNAIHEAARDLYDRHVAVVNDSYDGRRKVLRCFNHAIKNLRG